MLRVNNLPIVEAGNVSFLQSDIELLSTFPPTEESTSRARELGVFAAEFFMANSHVATGWGTPKSAVESLIRSVPSVSLSMRPFLDSAHQVLLRGAQRNSIGESV